MRRCSAGFSWDAPGLWSIPCQWRTSMTTRETARQFAVLEESDFWLRRGRMDEAELKHLLAEICAALAPLHERGQVHGRIAPSCVCLEASGRVFVASFEENGGEHFEERGGERAQAAAEKKRLLAGSEAYSSLSSQPGGATAAAQRARSEEHTS